MFLSLGWAHRIADGGDRMVGVVRYSGEKGKTPPRILHICGMPLLEVTLHVPPGLWPRRLERRLKRLERTLRQAEVGRVILPEQFPYELRQVKPVECLPMYRALADVLVLEWMRERKIPAGEGRVALTAPRLCPELEGTAQRLCARVREVRIDVPGGEGEWLARRLHREFGVPVLPAMALVDATVSFGPERGDLRLWGELPQCAGLKLRAEGAELPAELEQPLLALLWERGQVRREDIYAVKTAQKCGETLANAMDSCYTN